VQKFKLREMASGAVQRLIADPSIAEVKTLRQPARDVDRPTIALPRSRMNHPATETTASSVAAAERGLALASRVSIFALVASTRLRGVSFSARRGRSPAVIGPNGAGKTSVFNTISASTGRGGPDQAGGDDITDVPVHARAARGLARTFQNIALFRGSDGAREHQARRPPHDARRASRALAYARSARARRSPCARRSSAR
jgi:ABC-type glutathione transport system ATPase component